MREILITDVSLRDGIQSLLATRVRTEDLLPLIEILDGCGFWSLEVWGGATFDVCLRYLKEDPWERLKLFKKHAPNTKLEMLLRGQNVVGYRHYADDVVEEFVKKAYEKGIEVFRIFDALNDTRNMRKSIETAKKLGALVKGVLSYTISPVHKVEYYVGVARELVDMGIDIISIKDQAGLLSPKVCYELVKALKSEFPRYPVHLHTQTTADLAQMAQLKGVEAGAEMIDTVFYSLSCQTSHPPGETMIYALREFGYTIKVEEKLYQKAGELFASIRKKYKKYDVLPPYPDVGVLLHQVPGGMISNFISQLKEQGMEEKLPQVLEEVVKVREDLGYPPLVTPTSQIVGSQAFLNVVQGERYKVVTKETRDYVKGLYGRPPAPIREEIIKKILGEEKPIYHIRPADLLQPELPLLREEAIKAGAKSEEDVLSYALFPLVAKEFFDFRAKGEKLPPEEVVEEKRENIPVEFVITVHGEQYHVQIAGRGEPTAEGRPFFVRLDGKLEEVLLRPLKEVESLPSPYGEITSATEVKPKRPRPVGVGDITSPISGKVVNIKVTPGQQVKEGEVLFLVEAMKMENEVHSPLDGSVEEVFISVGDVINPDEVAVRIKPTKI
ncbi:MAG: sodium-extruding oxaloacetate decarboxylase subunit alpha [Aquificaceae bacterium]|nr:sodium-extruding oxaloacetate decarboxylase subunit alpha [Aquificaceae bacterium]MCX7989718.1 sodium-extruding oxaloacetate decarboxylase subunit alpha [Aquificaceae bacterium]MDW8295003.1 sodium-extruding oxaloacetate decarboxylase subunit alpha [Aquificaceae bacterium]